MLSLILVWAMEKLEKFPNTIAVFFHIFFIFVSEEMMMKQCEELFQICQRGFVEDLFSNTESYLRHRQSFILHVKLDSHHVLKSYILLCDFWEGNNFLKEGNLVRNKYPAILNQNTDFIFIIATHVFSYRTL